MTAAQEAILEQIIEAFQNGKRLSDLPDVSGTNPFNLICEVLEDGESKKAALATLLPYMEEECSYGIEFDTAVSSPACTRIGNLSRPLHRLRDELPPLGRSEDERLCDRQHRRRRGDAHGRHSLRLLHLRAALGKVKRNHFQRENGRQTPGFAGRCRYRDPSNENALPGREGRGING